MNHNIHATFHSNGDSYSINGSINDLKSRLDMIEDKVSVYDEQFIKMTELLRAQKDYIESMPPPESHFESVFTDLLARINDIEKSVSGANQRISDLEHKFYERKSDINSDIKQQIQSIHEQNRDFHDNIYYKINTLQTKSFNTPHKDKQENPRDEKRYKKTKSIKSRGISLSRKSSIRSRR